MACPLGDPMIPPGRGAGRGGAGVCSMPTAAAGQPAHTFGVGHVLDGRLNGRGVAGLSTTSSSTQPGEEHIQWQPATITIVGNLTRDPELRFTPSGQATPPSGWRSTAAGRTARPGVGRGHQLLRRRLLGPAGRERRPVPHQGHTGHRHRPPRPAQLGDRRGRQALQGRDHRRRGRPVASAGRPCTVSKNERKQSVPATGGDYQEDEESPF